MESADPVAIKRGAGIGKRKGPLIERLKSGLSVMTESTRRSKRPNHGGTLDTSRKAPEKGHSGADGKRPPVSQTVARDQAGPGTPGAQAGLAFHLEGPQHAQVTMAVFEQEQIGSALVGMDGRIQHVNQTLADLLHYKQEELTGKALDDFVCAAERAQHCHAGTETLPSLRRGPPEVNHLARKSGGTIACHIDSHAIRDASGNTTHFLVFVADARSRKEAEERNRFESALYQAQALQTLGMLAGGVAHDFNNALEVIIGFASLTRIRLSPADPLQEPLKIIEESAKGAADLARQLLDVSKDDPDGEKPIDVDDLIGTVLSIITRTFDRKVRIDHRIDPGLPYIKGIRNRLEQAILNLCINARDAMRRGGTLAIEATSQTLNSTDPRLPASVPPGKYVRIAVRDGGMGMTPEVMEQIFVPLFTTKGRGQGTGLGLAMVDRVIREAQGFIAVSSTPGAGSEFAIYLPADFSVLPRAVRPRPSELVSGRGKVLVVDDEPRVLEFLEKGLTRLGYDVVAAESGSIACKIYSGQFEEINCVLLDLIMPGMGGLDTYARLRDINPHVKVILSSGYSSGRVKREAIDAGSPEFLEKPYTLEELSQALQKIQQN